MDYIQIINTLKEYHQTPELIMYDVLIGIYNNNFLSSSQYDYYRKLWTKIKYYAYEEYSDVNTYYQYFTDKLYNTINRDMNWSHEIGKFKLGRKHYCIVTLSCRTDIRSKVITVKVLPINKTEVQKIFVNGISNVTKLCIEDDTTYNFNNIKKIIKICETLNIMNSCKKCNKIIVSDGLPQDIDNYEYCTDCLKNSATKIQTYWRRSISDPNFTLCQNRLLNEFTELPIELASPSYLGST
jgi:hypothetical protein